MFISNNLPSFQLWRKENLVKHPKVSKLYQTDSLKNFLFLMMFLLPTNFVEKSNIWPRIFFIFLKSVLNHTWNAFNTKFRRQSKDRRSSYLVREAFSLFSYLIAIALGKSSVKCLTVTKILKENFFEGIWDDLQSKKCFQRQSVTKYLRLTLVSMWNSTPREKFNR